MSAVPEIRPALESDLEAVRDITRRTISAVYPRYYPKGAVEFFLAHHSDEKIRKDIAEGKVFLCVTPEQTPAGTVTLNGNEICRLFVLPEHQGKGFGKALLCFAENEISKSHSEIVMDASLSAKGIYLKRGYTETGYNVIDTAGGDHLCYDIMKKKL